MTPKTNCVLPIWYNKQGQGIQDIASNICGNDNVMHEAFGELIKIYKERPSKQDDEKENNDDR